MKKNYKHIIWDWNGTLFDDTNLCVDIINTILTEKKLNPLSYERYREIFTFPVKKYYALTGLDLEKDSFEILGRHWMDMYEARWKEAGLHRNAVTVLQSIYKSEIPQSILSAAASDYLKDAVDHYKISGYFTHLAGLNHIYATSKVDLGKELIKNLKLEEGSVLMIGDTLHDAEVAEAIGIDCMLIAGGHQNRDILSTAGVLVLDDLSELLNLFTG